MLVSSLIVHEPDPYWKIFFRFSELGLTNQFTQLKEVGTLNSRCRDPNLLVGAISKVCDIFWSLSWGKGGIFSTAGGSEEKYDQEFSSYLLNRRPQKKSSAWDIVLSSTIPLEIGTILIEKFCNVW